MFNPFKALWRWLDSLMSVDQPLPPGPLPATVWGYLSYAFKQCWKVVLPVPVLTIAIAASASLIPLLLAVVIDTLVLRNDQAWSVQALIGLAIICLLVPPILEIGFYSLWLMQASNKLPTLLVRQGHKYLRRQSWSFFQNEFAGRINAKVDEAAGTTRALFSATLDQAPFVIAIIITSFGVLAYVHWSLALTLLVWCCCVGSAWIVFTRKARKFGELGFEQQSLARGIAVDGYSNIQTLMLFSKTEDEDPLLVGTLKQMLAIKQRANIWYTLASITMRFLNYGLLAALIGLSLLLWNQGLISAGALVVGIPVGLKVTENADWLSDIILSIAENSGILKEALQTISQEQSMADVENAADLQVSDGAIRFDRVSFQYNANQPLFEGFDLNIDAGQRIALVGPSGAGKTSIVSLLLRLFDVDQGRISIDNQDISKVNRDSLRAQIAVVTQDTSLLHRSIADNIRYGRPDASDEAVQEAARAAQAHDFIETLSDHQGNTGYAVRVGERGVKLSGGQRQRIAMARVLLKDAPILVFDEATSALDSETEAYVHQQIRKASKGKTLITIAHRLSTIQDADQIFVFDHGKIVETGSHAELRKRQGLYAELWSRQAETL